MTDRRCDCGRRIDEVTDPKPPAASGDQYDTLAAKYACESGGCCCNLQGDDFAHFMRTAASEAQLRVLDEFNGCNTAVAMVKTIDSIRARIEKDGPL